MNINVFFQYVQYFMESLHWRPIHWYNYNSLFWQCLLFHLNLILLHLIFALKRLKTQRVKSHLSVDMFMACWNCWVMEALAMPPKELRSFWLLWNIRWAASLRWSGLTYDPFLSCMPLFRKCCNMTFCPCPSNVECLGVEANMCLGIVVSVRLWSLWIVWAKTISEKGKIQANLNGFYTWNLNRQNLDTFWIHLI